MILSLEKYNGPWTRKEAFHLIQRTSCSVSYENIEFAVKTGLSDIISQHILKTFTHENEPINYYYPDDPDVPLFESWVNSKYSSIPGVNPVTHRMRSLRAWVFKDLMSGSLSIHNMLNIFWHNHFPVQESTVPDPKVLYNYYKTIHAFSLGNFKNFTKAICINPAMLHYLNGHSNSKFAPNENFARELLELFTVGIGQQIGSGDYSHYTENDIKEIARIFTGWQSKGTWDYQGIPVHSIFRPGYHDKNLKTLSHHFDYWTIEDNGVKEYDKLIDRVFEEENVSLYISRKIYKWFIAESISEEVENEIIVSLASELRENNFEILPVLKTLLESELFFSVINDGQLIKNPISFLVSTLHLMEINLNEKVENNYEIFEILTRRLVGLQMPLFEPPNVAGWKAYYQTPSFNKLWINANTVRDRIELTEKLSTSSLQFGGHSLIRLEVESLLKKFKNSFLVNNIIPNIYRHFLNQEITDSHLECLKPILTNNGPDYTWTVLFEQYLQGDEEITLIVKQRIGRLVNHITSLSQFQLN